tara:strand:- start:14213 stop:15124 length:912 start_codon:yes stop_codon:yes gene_type:complete
MNNDINTSNSINSNDEINIIELLAALWQGKWLIIALTSFFSISAVLYSLYLPDIYEPEALLSPVGSEGRSSSSNSIGGLASLAGINLSSKPSGNSAKALEKVKTLSFFQDNILPNIHLPDLMAMQSWNADTNTMSYKSEYNQETKTWNEIPSAQESYDEFKDLMKFSQDYDSGFVTISIKHKSPHVAKEWIELIVNQLNYFFRTNDKQEAQLSMDFLNAQIAQTSYTEIKQVIAQLLQNKMQQLTLIEANEFYVFSYLDPPQVMEKRDEPNRVSISILGFIFGGMLGILVVIIREFFSIKNLK